ncbi:MAG: hypothetical protein LBU08_03205 [Tannerellaceae bacterium]|jgi:hypothetical protein|nr:hypothetical protein [Tannerellaceae bacterium]
MKRRKYRIGGLWLWLALAAGLLPLSAQRTMVEMTGVEPGEILIGEQATLRLRLTQLPGKVVQLLLPEDTLMAGVEIVEVGVWDSSEVDGLLTLERQVVITSFDSSLYLLPAIRAVEGGDTLWSNRVALKVSNVPGVDVEHPETFFDLKALWLPPFVWQDYLVWLWSLLALLALGGGGWYVWKRWRAHKPLLPEKETPRLPPHERAFEALAEIKQQKLWQQGKHKEYYTGVTDTLRYYIWERFGIEAMEKTSGEILGDLRGEQSASGVYADLADILTMADLVKFAKNTPLADENDSCMSKAYLFVEETKKKDEFCKS